MILVSAVLTEGVLLPTNARGGRILKHLTARYVTTTSIRKLFPIFASVSPMCFAHASTARAGSVVFDNLTAQQNLAAGSAVNVTGSNPNTFMGDGYILTAGTTKISGFDFAAANLTGTNYTGLEVNLDVWGNVNTGTVNSTTPAFGSLLGTYTITATGSFNSGVLYYLSTVTLSTPLAISGTTIGLTFNVQGTTDGTNYSSANALTSVIESGVAPTVGAAVFNGYYRNANSETNGNFTSTLRSLGLQDQTIGVRIYGDSSSSSTPEPATFGMVGMGLLVMLRRRT